MIDVSGGANTGQYLISWRANWSDNDGNVAGGQGYISSTNMHIIIPVNSTMALSNYTLSRTIQQNSNDSSSFLVKAPGTGPLNNVSISMNQENSTPAINSSWVTFYPSLISLINPGHSSNVTINVSIPYQTAPGNYTGVINVSGNAGEEDANFTIDVPANGSWYIMPSTNFTFDNSYFINNAGQVGNYTVVDTGNINFTLNITYLPTSHAGTDFTLYGSELFPFNYPLNGMNANPTTINVTEGLNTSVVLWQIGSAYPLSDVGITMKITNSSASPSFFELKDTFNILSTLPFVKYIWFSLDNFNTNTTVAGQYKPLTIKMDATDSLELNTSGATFNVTWATGSTIINATALDSETNYSGDYPIEVNFSAPFTPTTTGVYSVTGTVYNSAGEVFTSNSSNFTVFGSTLLTLNQNISVFNVSNVDLTHQESFSVNYTLNNTGLVTAYAPTLTFSGNSSIFVQPYNFSDLPAQSVESANIPFNVSALTLPGQYTIVSTLTWFNPNLVPSTESQTLTVIVFQNKSFVITPSTLNYPSIPHGTSASQILTINNTGNIMLSNITLNCSSGSFCSSLNVGYNISGFNISINSSQQINITAGAHLGLAAGVYNGVVNISEQNISNLLLLQANVPSSLTWGISSNLVSATVQASSTGKLSSITINNTGNSALSFILGSTNSSIAYANESSLTVPAIGSGMFDINYIGPSVEGTYNATILINESTHTAIPSSLNVTVNLSITDLIVAPSTSYKCFSNNKCNYWREFIGNCESYLFKFNSK